MSRFGGTALQALQTGLGAQEGQAAQIASAGQAVAAGQAQRSAQSAQAAQFASGAAQAGAQATAQGQAAIAQGVQSVNDVFSQLFQAKFARDMERERAERQATLEETRRNIAAQQNTQRQRGEIQELLQQVPAQRKAQLELLRPGEDATEQQRQAFAQLEAQAAAEFSGLESLNAEFARVDQAIKDGVAARVAGAHVLTGRFVRASAQTAQLDAAFKSGILARGAYREEQTAKEVAQLQRHEEMVARHVQLGVAGDFDSFATSLKKGDMSDSQIVQKLLSSRGVPQTARMSDVVSLLTKGGSQEDREESLASLDKIMDSGELDVSTFRAMRQGLNQLLDPSSANSLDSLFDEHDVDPKQRRKVRAAVNDLVFGLNYLELSKPAVSQLMKRDRSEVWRQAMLNGHPNDLETQTAVFKAMEDAKILAPEVLTKLRNGTPEERRVATAALAEIAGKGPSGQQGGDLLKAMMDANKEAGSPFIRPEQAQRAISRSQEPSPAGTPKAGPSFGEIAVSTLGAGFSEMATQEGIGKIIGAGTEGLLEKVRGTPEDVIDTPEEREAANDRIDQAEAAGAISKTQARAMRSRVEKQRGQARFTNAKLDQFIAREAQRRGVSF